VREDTISQFEAYLVPSNELFIFLNQKHLEQSYETERGYAPGSDDKEGILIIVHFIGCNI
jgi:hypothetical protein